jgi:hypothetical protein
MLIDIVEVEPKDQYVLWLKFEDGTEGTVDIKKLLGHFTGVFAKLQEPTYFKTVEVDSEVGTISWSNEIDLCQDILYAAVKGLPKPHLGKNQSA